MQYGKYPGDESSPDDFNGTGKSAPIDAEALRFCAQPGGVEVAVGETEIVVSFPGCDQYGDLGRRVDVAVDLDSATARHLASLLGKTVPTEEEETQDQLAAESITLDRTGNAPLSFRGRCVASADGERLGGRERNRWYELAVYRTQRSRYVLAVHYRTRWQGELDHDAATACNTLEEVAACLRDFDPLSTVAGYPPGQAYAERQARLEAEIVAGYRSLVSQVLKEVGATETIE